MIRRNFFKKLLSLGTGFFSFAGFKNIASGSLSDWLYPQKSGANLKTRKIPKLGLKSKIIIAQDSKILAKNGIAKKDATKKLISESIKNLTGEKDELNAWKSLFGKDDIVGIKINCLAGKGLSTRKEIVDLIIEGLRSAGLDDEQVIVWDKADIDLQKAGYTINYSGKGAKCFGTNKDYDAEPEIIGSVGSCFSKIISSKCTAIINVPILKDHELSGVSLAMKNFYGAIHNPNKYHDSNCNPYVADLYSHPFIRDKVRLIICDAINAQYHGGPGYKPQWGWNFNGIIMGTDPVALDKIGAKIIENKRREKGFPSFKDAKREPKYIATAADLKLGNDDPAKIEVVRV